MYNDKVLYYPIFNTYHVFRIRDAVQRSSVCDAKNLTSVDKAIYIYK